LARRDIESAIDHYAREAGADVAQRFLNSVRTAFRAIGDRPGTGSPRYGEELDLPGLRHRPAGRFPYLIFYVDHASHVEIWRVVHAQRDIPAELRPGDATDENGS
jgi:toxin ParE1/3/4